MFHFISMQILFNISQSHMPIELEQGTLGLNVIRPSNEILVDDRATLSANVADAVNSSDSQILPSHLKCGMWASLALATVFLAGLFIIQLWMLYHRKSNGNDSTFHVSTNLKMSFKCWILILIVDSFPRKWIGDFNLLCIFGHVLCGRVHGISLSTTT